MVTSEEGSGAKRAWLALGATLAGLALHVALVLALPTSRLVTLVPDDAFYYLVLAKNHALTGRWTFDGGLTTTTGFHLLHAWSCSLAYRVVPSLGQRAALDLHILLGAVLVASSAVLLVRGLQKVGTEHGMLAVPLVLLSGGALGGTVMVMEWPWVVFAGALGFHAIATGRVGVALLAGVIGSLARSDFPLAALSAGGAVLLPRWGAPAPSRRAGLAFAIGALVGLAVVVAHTYALSGELVQASARMKSHWSRLAGYDPLPGLDAIALATPLGYAMLRSLDWGTLTFAALAAPAAGYVLVRSDRSRARWLLFGSAAALGGYVVLYGFTSAAAQAWYSANAVVPLALFGAAALDDLGARARRIVGGSLLVLVLSGLLLARTPTYPGQEQARSVAGEIAVASGGGRVAAWNAGTYSYFSRVPIVNLDGLVNDEVHPYAVSGRLACYVLEKEIDVIVDAEGMFVPKLARRGGYEDGTLREALEARPLATMVGGSIMMWRVDRGRLRETCRR